MSRFTENSEAIIFNIRQRMDAQRLSQQGLAAQSKLSVWTISRVLNGNYPLTPNTVEKIASGLNVEYEELVGKTVDPDTVSESTINGYIEYNGQGPVAIKTIKQFRTFVEMVEKNERLASTKQNKLPRQTPITLDDIDFDNWEEIDATKFEVKSFKSGQDIVEGEQFDVGNMCPGYPFELNGVPFFNSETAYIAGMFSNDTEEHRGVQMLLKKCNNGFGAKKTIRRPNEDIARKDWETYNIEWMKYVVWSKCKTNEAFAKKLKAVPKTAMIVENSTGMNALTAKFWGCHNKELEELRTAKENKYAVAHKKPSAEELSAERNRWCNFGTWSGTNMMGKILKACSICLQTGIELPIDYELLQSKHIYLLGKEVEFPSVEKASISHKSIIIDLDNTLINTAPLDPYYVPIRKAEFGSEEQKEAWNELFKHIDECSMYDGMQDVLNYIKRNKVKISLVSNSPMNRMTKILQAFKVPIPKEKLVGRYTCGSRFNPIMKPRPEPILKGVELLEETKENVVVFGNSPDDIEAAKRAGVKSAACLWGALNEVEKQAVIDAAPDYILQSPKEIIDVITGKMK